MKPLVFDCFCFFNEHDLLKLRLETLWDAVDVFVLVESSFTFSGKPKPLHYDATRFAQYSDKIRHIIVKDFPGGNTDAWLNERFQRNAIERGLADASPQDWIIVGDVDEIPNPERIREFNPSKFYRGDFLQRNFAYYLNNCNIDKRGNPILWRGSKITTYEKYKKFFGCAERVRSFKSSGVFRAFKRDWFHRFNVQCISDGGWHFSWMSGLDSIITKLESFSHQEYNTPEIKSKERILEVIKSGEDILKMGARFKRFNIDQTFPLPLVNFPHEYTQMLLAPDVEF